MDSLKISRILHAGYVFEFEGQKIAFDPIFESPFSQNCYAYPNIKFNHEQVKKLKFDAVFISHYHDDHCSFDSLNLLNRDTPLYLYCIFDELFSWIRELGFTRVQRLKVNEQVKIGTLEITPFLALDADIDSIFHIKAKSLNVLNVVDSWIDPSALRELERFAPWDMVLWPFQTMREIEVLSPSRFKGASRSLPPEWIEQLITLNPRYIVPSSCQFIHEPWSWYRKAFFPISYKQFEEEVLNALPHGQIVRLNPSISIELNKNSIKQSSGLPWIEPVGEQDVDYEFDEELTAPSTAEIAKYFEPLDDQKKKKVFDYCNKGLLQRFRELGPTGEGYFLKERIWRLSLYDQHGIAMQFNYLLRENSIERISGTHERLGWLTEVPISKLYSALEEGEALTSLYLRVNDWCFEAETENELRNVDIMEDPLIRCLYSGVFGSYQLAQLKRIKNGFYQSAYFP